MVYLLTTDFNLDWKMSSAKLLKGDLDKLRWVGRQTLQLYYGPPPGCEGKCVDASGMPRLMKIGGKKQLPPDLFAKGYKVVSERFREVVERIEPGVHQFEPIRVVRKSGEEIGTWYWLFCCNWLDSLSRAETTLPPIVVNGEMRGWRETVRGAQMVFSRPRIGGRHMWIDKFIGLPNVYVSGTLKEAISAAGLEGVTWRHYPETDAM